MHFPTSLLAILAATSNLVLAAPAPAKMAVSTTWTIEAFQRQCTTDPSSCRHRFGINTHDGQNSTQCDYTSSGPFATYEGIECGDFVIGSTHSDDGFQVLSVKRPSDMMIVYPGYKDEDVDDGSVQADQDLVPVVYS